MRSLAVGDPDSGMRLQRCCIAARLQVDGGRLFRLSLGMGVVVASVYTEGATFFILCPPLPLR